jgi:hypothetical protein
MILRILFGIAFLFPAVAWADIRISEIAWMGTEISTSDEWIELENTGSDSVSLSGWTLVALDDVPTLTLTGSIAGYGTYLIERTDDTSVPHITADLVSSFGSGIENGGETLVLRDAGGVERDRVVGEDAWSTIGGENESKMTPQRTGDSWVTATPTPRALTTAPPHSSHKEEESAGEVAGVSTVSAPSTVSSGNAPSVYPRPSITVRAGEDVFAFVGIPVSLVGSSTGLYDEALPHATYRWNFGDGSTGEGPVVSHVYQYAGEYAVTLEVFHAEHVKRDRLIVRVEAPLLSLVAVEQGESRAMKITSLGSREMDLSSFVLRDEVTMHNFVLPRNTILLPGRSMYIPAHVSGMSVRGAATLLYDGQVMASTPPAVAPSRVVPLPISITTTSASQPSQVSSLTPPQRPKVSPNLPAVTAQEVPQSDTVVLYERKADSVSTGTVMAAIATATDSTLFLSLFALSMIGVAGFLMWKERQTEPTIADEYAIIEDIIEGKDDLDPR